MNKLTQVISRKVLRENKWEDINQTLKDTNNGFREMKDTMCQ